MKKMSLAVPALIAALSACNAIRDPITPPPYLPRDVGPQSEYTYPQCPNEDGQTCPRMKTAQCAVGWIGQRFAYGCSWDDDCELVSLKPSCFSVCTPLAVLSDDAPVFRDEAQREAEGYCRRPGGCSEVEDCPAAHPVAICSAGLCVTVDQCDLDGGLPDGGCARPVPDGGASEDASLPDDAGTAEAPDAGLDLDGGI